MRKIIFVMMIQFIVCSCCGQYIRFNNVYFVEDEFNAVGEAIVVRDNFEIISGSSFINGGQKLFYTKLDNNGVVIDSSFIDIGTGYGLSYNIIDFENHFLICKSTPPTCSSAVYSTYLAMINHDLEMAWQHQFTEWDNTEDCRDTWISCMTKYNEDKAFVICRVRISGNTNNIISPQYSGYKFVILDQNGNTLHDHEEIEEIQTFKRYRYDQVKQLDAESFLVWGTVTLTADNPLNAYGVQNDQAFVRKINIYGDDLGTVLLGGSKNEASIGCLIDDIGNCNCVYNRILSGSQFNKITELRKVIINTSNMSILTEEHVPNILFDNIPLRYAGGAILEMASDNEAYIVGCGYTFPNSDDSHTVVGKLNFNNEWDWLNEYTSGIPNQQFEEDIMTTFVPASDGGYYAGGYVQYFNEDNSLAQKPWLFKIDACGDLMDEGCPALVGVEETMRNFSFISWPNPFHQELKANLPDDAVLVEWLDMSGRIIHTEQVFYPKQSFNLSKLADGNYVMRVVMQDGTSSVKRVVKQ